MLINGFMSAHRLRSRSQTHKLRDRDPPSLLSDHCGTTIKKGDYVIDLVYWDRPSTGDPLLFEDEAKKATVHAEHVLHANVAPTAAADDRVRVSEAVVAEIEAEHEVFRNT